MFVVVEDLDCEAAAWMGAQERGVLVGWIRRSRFGGES